MEDEQSKWLSRNGNALADLMIRDCQRLCAEHEPSEGNEKVVSTTPPKEGQAPPKANRE